MTFRIKKIFFIILLGFFLLGPFLALAQDLEVKYPIIKGIQPVAKGEDALPTYIRYIFYLAIAIAGLVAFASLVYGGFRYLASAGSPVAMSDARSQMTAGILGMILLLGSVLLLNAINPRLTVLSLEFIPLYEEIEAEELPGVYLVSDEIIKVTVDDEEKEFLRKILTLASIPNLASPTYDFDNKTKEVHYTQPDFDKDGVLDFEYLAILHQDSELRGECRYIPQEGEANGHDIYGKVNGVSSVTVFRRDPRFAVSDFIVKFYKNPNFFVEEGGDECVIDTLTDPPENINTVCGDGWNDEVYSLEVGMGYLLVAWEHPLDGSGRPKGKCEVFGPGQYPEIRTHYIGRCKVGIRIGPFGGTWKPCISPFLTLQGFKQ